MCGKEFFEKALFRRHVKKATHGKKGRVKQNLERECEHCGRRFTQLREYRRHINNHQGEWRMIHKHMFCRMIIHNLYADLGTVSSKTIIKIYFFICCKIFGSTD